jgi:hypothetical protein
MVSGATLAVVAICAILPGIASARPAGKALTQADGAATHAYLVDLYEYTQAVEAAAPAAVSAYEATANKIAGECPRAFAGAPRESIIGASESKLTARERGETERRRTQLGDLKNEIRLSLAAAEGGPLGPARAAFLSKLKTLPSGDRALTQAIYADMAGLEEDLHPEVPDTCADIKVWTASGYKVLSSASRAIAEKIEARFPELLRRLAEAADGNSLSGTEDPADEALVGKITQLELQTAKAITTSLDSAHQRLEVALALPVRETASQPVSHGSTSSTQIGAGRTAAGTGYTVWLERTKGGSADVCKLGVEVRRADDAKRGILEILTNSGSGVCLSPAKDRSGPTVNCSEGLLKIQAEVPPSTRTVDLRMSNGTQIVSRATLVPRRLGGPAAFYYQAVRGPSPIPVALIERDAHGHTLRVVKLSRLVGCSKHPLKYLPGGRATLAHGQAPQGPSFSIVGERYLLFGRIHTRLTLGTGEQAVSSGSGEEDSENPAEEGPGQFEESPGEFVYEPVRRPTPLDSRISAGCQPHEYSILYGLLKKPDDTVLAKISGQLVPLRRVQIPASLHIAGVLVYLASDTQPEATVVRSPSGKVVLSEGRGRRATEERETCEGESEGAAGPPPGGFGGSGETNTIALSG